jgi:hypothetical protein
MSLLFGRTVVSTVVTNNRWLRPLSVLVRHQSLTSKECVTACNNQQILLIILHVPCRLGRGNLFINSPTELQYLELTLIFEVFARTCASSTFF